MSSTVQSTCVRAGEVQGLTWAQNAECSKTRMEWAHEQQAFSVYVRPTLIEGEEYIAASCHDGNGGVVDVPKWGCHGAVRRQAIDLADLAQITAQPWHAKAQIAGYLTRTLGQELVRTLVPLLQHMPH